MDKASHTTSARFIIHIRTNRWTVILHRQDLVGFWADRRPETLRDEGRDAKEQDFTDRELGRNCLSATAYSAFRQWTKSGCGRADGASCDLTPEILPIRASSAWLANG